MPPWFQAKPEFCCTQAGGRAQSVGASGIPQVIVRVAEQDEARRAGRARGDHVQELQLGAVGEERRQRVGLAGERIGRGELADVLRQACASPDRWVPGCRGYRRPAPHPACISNVVTLRRCVASSRSSVTSISPSLGVAARHADAVAARRLGLTAHEVAAVDRRHHK